MDRIERYKRKESEVIKISERHALPANNSTCEQEETQPAQLYSTRTVYRGRGSLQKRNKCGGGEGEIATHK